MKGIKRKKISSYIFLLLAVVFFNSCAWWEKQKRNSSTNLSMDDGYGQAPFVVDQVESAPNQSAVSISPGADGLIKKFNLNLKTCLRDYIKQDNPIQNIRFTIEYYKNQEDRKKGSLTKTEAVSNTSGCIQWQEQYDYKYTAKPLWIGLERRIKKEKGAYTGEVNISMAVNLWLSDRDRSSGLPYILDIRSEYSRGDSLLKETQNYEQDGLKYLSEIKQEDKPLLWVPDVDIQVHEINPNKDAINTKEDENLEVQSQEDKIRKLLKKYQEVCQGESSKNCYLRQMEMSLFIPLKLRTLDKSGLRQDELLGGTYDVETQLIISPKEARANYLLHEKICERNNIQFNKTNKSLTLSCRLNFSYFNENALYKLVIRIKPSYKDLPFKKFEGVYTIDLNFQNEKSNPTIDTGYEENYEEALTTSNELKIIESLKIKNIAMLNKNAKNFQSGKEESKIQTDKGPITGLNFYRLHLDGEGEYKLSHVESGGSKCSDRENVVERTVVFVGELCLEDVLSSQKLNNTPFRIFLEKPQEGVIEEKFYLNKRNEKQLFKTNVRGCISVPISIRHKIYNRQKYFQVDMHVLSEELNLYGKIRLALSPWQRAFQAFQDAQDLPPGRIRFDTTRTPKPQLIINQFRSINLFPSYGLDKLLNIHFFHRVYLLFQPFIRRPDNLSLGLDYKARELLRDGHYLVRVLVLRNPQETGDSDEWSRVQIMDDLNESRKNEVTKEYISLKGAQYITHTDSVIKAKANFVNFYMPLFLLTEQFYYIVSRNFIVIEIHPADPNYFVYKQENSEECIVDTEKTVWKPFRDHELQNNPYVGAFNIQQWVNWNLLQPVSDLNTDEIIEQSEIGKKYKHFNFSSDNESSLNRTAPSQSGCVNEVFSSNRQEDIQNVLYQHDQYNVEKAQDLPSDYNTNYNRGRETIESHLDPSREEIEGCTGGNNNSLSPGIEAYKHQEEQYFNSDVLENFSKENSLRLIKLSDQSSKDFIKDIQSSFERYEKEEKSFNFKAVPQSFSIQSEHQFYSAYHLFQMLPKEDFDLLNLRIDKLCNYEKDCFFEILRAYLMNAKQGLNTERKPIEIAVDIINKNKLLSDKERLAFNESLQECENFDVCLMSIKKDLLKVLDLFIKELSFYEQNLFLENLMMFFSKDQKQDLFEQIKQECSLWRLVIKGKEDYKKCYYKEFSLFYERIQPIKHSNFYRQAYLEHQSLSNGDILQTLYSFGEDIPVLRSVMDKPTKQNLMRLIDEGIKSENKYSIEALSFTKSLCFFWFDHYLKNYLETDQMIGAYTSFISKFDYHQIWDHSYSVKEEKEVKYLKHAMSFYPSIIKLLESYDNEQSAGCYEDYTQCILADHCQARSINESKMAFCSKLDINDKTCPALLKEECQRDSSLSLCSDKCLLEPNSSHCSSQYSCNSEVRDFCLINKSHKLCARYENRCVAEYVPCLKSNTSVFNINQVLNYKEGDIYFEPLKTCLNDPYDFFEFENKMVIHELSKEGKKYEGGFLKTLNVAANYSIGSYMNWTAQRGRSLSVSGDVSLTSKVANWLGLTFLKLGVSQTISSNESNSGRRAADMRGGESIFFTIGNAKIRIGVQKFQNCLVVKPRPHGFFSQPEEGEKTLFKEVWSQSANAFNKILISRPGLALCNPIENRTAKPPKYITEDYYYVSQMLDSGNSQFLNLYDLANRPLMVVLRGRKEFVKLYHFLKLIIDGDNGVIEENGGVNRPPENMFAEYPFPVEETVGLSLTIREFSETGFSPGIYNYPYDTDQYLDTWYANETAESNTAMEALTEYNLFDIPPNTNHSIPVQERSR